jgi:acyl-CoA thioester hydrolase
MGHLNVMWYVGKFDEASWQLLLKLGLCTSRFSKDGSGMVAVEQCIDYKSELCAGDLVTIRSTVLEVDEKWIRLSHEMTNDATGVLAATTVILGDVRERVALMIEKRATE